MPLTTTDLKTEQESPASLYGSAAIFSVAGGAIVWSTYAICFAGKESLLFQWHELSRAGSIGALAGLSLGAYCLLALAIPLWRAGIIHQQIRRRYAGHPWMWRSDWRENRAISTPTADADTLRTAFFGLAFVSVLLAMAPGILRKIDFPIFQEFAFRQLSVVFGIAALIAGYFWIIRHLQLKRFGQIVFTLDKVPVQPGEELKGYIDVPGIGSQSVQLVLNCLEWVSMGRSGHLETRWTIACTAVAESRINSLRSAIPVRIKIPPDARPTDYIFSWNRNPVYWELIAQADLPGVNLFAQFRVPVFLKMA
jgi:hypothetical protein